MNIYDAKGKSIELGESVGRGGEATVYRLRGQTGWLAKIYERGPRPNYADKLAWMISHPPENPTARHRSFLTRLAFQLAVRLEKQAGRLYDASYPRSRTHARRLQPTPAAGDPAAFFDRLYLHRTARNLSATLIALHARGYVVGDLNESNVLVTPSALISLIDTDSFQVQEMRGNQVVSHPCPVGKLEYTPPELHGQAIGSIVRQPEHDAFALGVLIFQLLMEGSHPFRAQWLGSGDPPPVETRIAQGIFPYTTTPDSRVRPPKGAPDLNQLHPALVELAYRCFIDGHQDPQQRPVPEHWELALTAAEKALVRCPNHHLYSNHLARCPHCSAPATQSSPGATQSSPGATSHTAGQKPPKPRQKPRPTQPNPAFRHHRSRPASPAFNWQAYIASRMNSSWPRASYPSGVPYPSGIPYQPRPSSPSPSWSHPGSSQSWSMPVYRPGSLKAWVSPRLSKSLFVGGGLGALVGALIGGLAGLASASLGEIAAWTLLWALGGAAAGMLRGWKPGYRLSRWVDRHLGWDRVLPVFGLLAGAMLGMLFGFVIGWWAIIPVFIGLFLGARLGRKAGRKAVEVGNRIGWDRIWAGIGAGGAALVGWRVAVWLGGGAVGGLAVQGAASLSSWISGLFSVSTPDVLLTAAVSGVLCGGSGRRCIGQPHRSGRPSLWPGGLNSPGILNLSIRPVQNSPGEGSLFLRLVYTLSVHIF